METSCTDEKTEKGVHETLEVISNTKSTGVSSLQMETMKTEVQIEGAENNSVAHNGVKIEKETDNSDLVTNSGATFTVFVGKLVDRVTVGELKQFFVKAIQCKEEEVLNVNMPCKVIQKTKRLGIAFVELANEQTYQASLTLNNTPLQGQNILVLPVNKTHEGLMLMDGTEREFKDNQSEKPKSSSNVDNVPVYKKSDHVAYIKNLPHGLTEDDVLEFFKFTRNDIVDIVIPIPFKAKRYAKRPVRAIIAFTSEEGLQKCLDQTKTKFREREVIVERHQMVTKVTSGGKRPAPIGHTKEDNETSVSPEKQLRETNPSDAGSNAGGSASAHMELDLFVKHIPREASDRQIKDFFSSAGATVTKVNLFSESVTGSSRGMGFVSMLDKESVQKGLLLDCKRFYKNKVRVAVRRDREHLTPLDKSEIIPNFCSFVGNLPIREKPEIVKKGLLKHFQSVKCNVKDINVPLPPNRSGNRGYAFIIFNDESSLKLGQIRNSSRIIFDSGNAKITVSDRWPENPEGEVFDNKMKNRNFEQNVSNSVQEPPGKLRKRKRGIPAPAIPSTLYPGLPSDPPDCDDFKKLNHWNGPPQLPSDGNDGPDFGSFNQNPPEYYLEYLEYRDYVAMRKAFDERRDFVDIQSHSRFRDDQETNKIIQQNSHPQSGMASLNFARQMNSMSKVGRTEDGFRRFPTYSSSEQENNSFEDSFAGGSQSLSRDYRNLDLVGSRRGGTTGDFPNNDTGSRDYSNIGVSGNNGYPSLLGNERSGFSDSLNSSRYQSALSSISHSQLFDSGDVGPSTIGFPQDSSTFRDSNNRMDNGRGRFSSIRSTYPDGSSDSARGFHSSLLTSGITSNIRSNILDSGRSQYESFPYSELDRTNSYGGGMEEKRTFPSIGGGSYSGKDLNQRYSYSAQGERRFTGHWDFGDQQKKGSLLDIKSEPRFGAPSSGYGGYTGHHTK